MAAPIPGQLGFLAIYNASLGPEDDQIVYYATVATLSEQQQRRRHRERERARNRNGTGERLSQAERDERLRNVGLARGMIDFGGGFAGGAPVDTVETDKARVIFHQLEPGWWIAASIDYSRVPLPPRLTSDRPQQFEYTSRDVKPAALLLQDLVRAHSTFLLHHDSSLAALLERSRRPRFVALLERYWDLFLSTWTVVLRGNPARDVLGGINLAASGELGVGVGEEDRGCAEREVLEGMVGRIDGLVDLVVSRFGHETSGDADNEQQQQNQQHHHHHQQQQHQQWLGVGIEPAAGDGAVFLGTGALSRKSLRHVTHWIEDLYTWGDSAYGVMISPSSTRQTRRPRRNDHANDSTAHYLIGLVGAIEEEDESARPASPGGSSSSSSSSQGRHNDDGDDDNNNNNSDDAHDNPRTMLRTLRVELEDDTVPQQDDSQQNGLALDRNKARTVRVVVYANRPFVFAFLFDLRAVSPALDSLYRSLHYQLAPLRKPLLTSTSYRPPDAYHVVWDPKARTVQCAIPNIGGPGRAEATNMHAHVLSMLSTTRADDEQRTCKTRGWWIEWSRLDDKEVFVLRKVGKASSSSGSLDIQVS